MRTVAAFDFDKTLSSRDNLLPFLRLACGGGTVARALARLAPHLVAAQLYDAHRDRVKEMLLRRLLAGRAEADLRALGEAFADDVVARHLRGDVVQRVEWHRARGHRLALVSAALSLYLEPVGSRLGFDAVLATELDVDESGCLTGELAGANVRRAEKARRLEHWLGTEPSVVWAYGNSRGDHELLARADHPIRVGRRRGELRAGSTA